MAKSIQYELDKTRNIKLDMNAIERYEDKTGKIFMSIDMSKISVTDMNILIWSGLHHEDTEITLEQVKALVDEYSDVVKLYEVVITAIMATMPEPKKTPQDHKPKNPKRA